MQHYNGIIFLFANFSWFFYYILLIFALEFITLGKTTTQTHYRDEY